MTSLIERARDTVAAAEIADVATYRRVASLVNRGARLTQEDWQRLGQAYLPFSEQFPSLLKGLISRLDDANVYPDARQWLEKILDEENGSADPRKVPHQQMFREFLLATGARIGRNDVSDTAERLFNGLDDLYLKSPLETALGAQTAFEFIGEEIIRNFSHIAFLGTQPGFDRTKLRYFDVHLVAEAEHVEKMKRVAEMIVGDAAEPGPHGEPVHLYLSGAAQAGRLLKAFWAGLWQPIPTRQLRSKLLFLSWSGGAAREVALELRRALTAPGDGIPMLSTDDIFFSDTDISSGQRWEEVIDRALADTAGGIIVLSPESVRSAWVNFEAGALYQRQRDRLDEGKTGDLHVVVLGSRPDEFLGTHPLTRFQVVRRGNAESMIQSVWRLVSAHRPLIETANPAHMERLAEAVKVILNKWSPEADRELDRRVENARDWLVYLLSLTSRDITCRQRPAADAPSILSAFSQVASVLRLLVGKYMGPRIEPGMRVYLATRLSEEARNLTYGRYSYRILYSAAGMDAEGHWMCDSLIGERSAIHQCFESGQPKPDDESNENAPVSDELAVHLRPVKVGNVVVCAIAISSNRQDPSHRLPDLCSEFEYILEWFLSIVATRIRQGTLKIAADSSAIGPKQTDDDIGLLVENQLQKINELNSFKKTREPREELKIKSSETPQA